MIAVYVAAFPAGGSVPLPRDSVLSGPHAPTTGHWGNPLPADAGPVPLFHRTRVFLFVTSVAGDTSGTLLQGGLGLWLCCYFVRVYVDSPGAGRTPSGRPGRVCLRRTPTTLGSKIRTSVGPSHSSAQRQSRPANRTNNHRLQRSRGEPQARPPRPAIFTFRSICFGRWSPLTVDGSVAQATDPFPNLPKNGRITLLIAKFF